MNLIFVLSLCILTASEIGADDCTTSVCVVNDKSLRFFALGDHGGQPVWPWYSPVQEDIAKSMAKLGLERNTHFQIALGDNFYTEGVKGVDDSRWKETYEDIYVGEALQRPWYVIAGNHDHRGKVEAEVEYSKHSKRWTMPDLNYTIKYQFGEGADTKLVQFVMFDSITLTGEARSVDVSWWEKTMERLGIRKAAPEGPADKAQSESQWTWIEDQLQQSKADYLFVMGHFPVYSIAEHGPTQMLVERMVPLLHRYHVTMYMSGHDHSLQHFQMTESDAQGKPYMVDYVVNGAGSRGDHSTKHEESVPQGSLKWHYPTGWDGGIGGLGFTDGGFSYLEITAKGGRLEFLDKEGKEKHSITFNPRT